jgi:N-acetylglutamate synthase-like GNAT family acetyltransferase
MHNPLFWIEWLDRLDRVLNSARQDVAVLKRALSPRSLEAIDRSKRQLAALLNDLRLLDRDVLAAGTTPSGADALQTALEATVAQLASLAAIPAASAPGLLDRMLASSDAALRDSCYEAAMLLAPDRRRVAGARADHAARL